MATKKGGGPRVVIDWGQLNVKKKGKKVAKKLSSRVLESTATLFGLKPSTVGGAQVKTLKTKKGNRVVISSPYALRRGERPIIISLLFARSSLLDPSIPHLQYALEKKDLGELFFFLKKVT